MSSMATLRLLLLDMLPLSLMIHVLKDSLAHFSDLF